MLVVNGNISTTKMLLQNSMDLDKVDTTLWISKK